MTKWIHFECYLAPNGLVLFVIQPNVIHMRKNMNVYVIFLRVEKFDFSLTHVNPYLAT